MAQRLTEQTVQRTKGPRTIYDAVQTGLGLKVTPAGKRIWIIQTRFPGHHVQTRRTLGTYPALGLAAAREKAAQWYSLARSGTDPTVHEEQAEAAARRAKALTDATTFASVAERFIAEHLAGQRRGEVGAREVRNYLVKAWGDRPIASIAPGDVKALIGRLKTTTPYQARNVFGHATVLFRWAVHNDLLEVAPTASLSKRWLLAGAHIGPRQRVLSDDDLRAFWRASGKIPYPYGPFYRLMLLLGVRISELSQARRSELHPELRQTIREAAKGRGAVDWQKVPAAAKVWTIPRERFKSDSEHVVPLSDDALDIIAGLPRFSGGDFMFTETEGRTAGNNLCRAKQRLDRLMLRALKAMARSRGEDPATVSLEPFVIHDLRRVVRTNLSALDIPDHVAEMALGHGRKGLQRVYDQHRYEPQIREALEKWAARLRSIVTPSLPTPTNVIPLAKVKVSA
jgi:integrase